MDPIAVAPTVRRSPAELLTLGLGAGGDDVDLESEIELGEFLCACPELELHSCLGRGGMGIVYRARQVRLDRDVAVKLMNPAASEDPEFARRFEREAKAMARLDHPGIVRVHDFGQAAGVYYLVMELVDGPNLRELIEQGLSDDQAAQIVAELCDALAYAHEHGVVHRDIKPENVLVDRRGRVRVADFGLAKLQAEPVAGATRTRRVLGTPQYMAPEQLRDPGSVDSRCDIFAIGVVFYEMLTGQLPVGRFPAPSELGRGDARLDEIVLRALESNRERRFQGAREIQTALSERDHVATLDTAVAIEPSPSPRRRTGMAVAVAGLAAAGLATLWISSSEPEPEPAGLQRSAPSPSEASAPEAEAAPAVAATTTAGPSVLDPAKQLNRWPAQELTVLDPEVIGVAGIDWSELRQSPVVTRLSEAMLAARPVLLERCKQDVFDRTHKVVVAFTATGVRELVIHGDWEPSQLQPCLDEMARIPTRDGQLREPVVESDFGPHRRLKFPKLGKTDNVVATIGHRDSTVVVSLREDITVEQLDAKLAGEATSTELRDTVIRLVDLAAPVWVAAEPSAGQLPMDMRTVGGGVELWDKLGLDVTATFADEAAATKGMTLAQSYVNIISTVPDFPSPPEVKVTQDGLSVRIQGTFELPELSAGKGSGMHLRWGPPPPLAEGHHGPGPSRIIEVDIGKSDPGKSDPGSDPGSDGAVPRPAP